MLILALMNIVALLTPIQNTASHQTSFSTRVQNPAKVVFCIFNSNPKMSLCTKSSTGKCNDRRVSFRKNVTTCNPTHLIDLSRVTFSLRFLLLQRIKVYTTDVLQINSMQLFHNRTIYKSNRLGALKKYQNFRFVKEVCS